MKTLVRNAAICAVALVIVALSSIAFAQQPRLPEEEWYGDTKRALIKHYVGKTVRARLPIPATRRGLELRDGAFQRAATPIAAPPIAQPGDELVIKSFKVTDHSIELVFNQTGAPPERARWNLLATRKEPRLKLHFSRELTGKDLTIESINRWLAAAVDVNQLAPGAATTVAEIAPVAERPVHNTPAAPVSASVEFASKTITPDESQDLPALPVVSELPALGANIGELVIECADPQARIYINESYSGMAPRTVRLRAGVHMVSVLRDGKPLWEQRLFVPGGKASLLRVGTNEAVKR